MNLKALVDKLNNIGRLTLESAASFCLSKTHYNIEIEHWLLVLMENKQSDVTLLLSESLGDLTQLKSDLYASLSVLKKGNSNAPAISERLIDLLKEALSIALLEFNDHQIRSSYILFALLGQEFYSTFLKRISVQFSKVNSQKLRELFLVICKESCENIDKKTVQSKIEIIDFSSNLEKFTIDLTEQARQGKLEEAVGRENEIRQIIDILMRRRQNNPILTGDPGVGKTALVEGLACQIVKGQVPLALQKVAIHALDLGLLQAGAGIRGEFENRLKSVIQEVKNSPHPIILFVDEAHTLIGSGAQAGQTDAANLLKPALARGELRTIAATTWAEYKKYFEKDAALARRFQVIKVDEPSVETAILMLRNMVGHLEKHHQLQILDEAVVAAVHLSHRYLADRLLPDKAVSVLDTACARAAVSNSVVPMCIQQRQAMIDHIKAEITLLERECTESHRLKQKIETLVKEKYLKTQEMKKLKKQWKKEREIIVKIRSLKQAGNKDFEEISTSLVKLKTLQGEKGLLHECVDAALVAEVIADWTGIPIGRMLTDELKNILDLASRLEMRIKGQSSALKSMSERIKISCANLGDPCRPIGVFLFVGPSGVGKTETALALTELLYASSQNLTLINLSEFKEAHKVSLLMGSPPGYVGYGEGGILTEAVRRRPYSLVLLDEVEKAHSSIQDVFYQVFDKGTLKDGEGRDINFKNTIIILTSNVGSELIRSLCENSKKMPAFEDLLEAIQPELLKFFKPAFLGRVTVIPYLSLNKETLLEIADLQLTHIKQRIYQHHHVDIYFDTSIQKYLVTQCKNAMIGARQIDYWLTSTLLPALSSYFLKRALGDKKNKKLIVNLNTKGQIVYAER